MPFPRVSAVLKPSAQYAIQGDAYNAAESNYLSAVLGVINDCLLPVALRALIETMYIGGLRVSEALNIKCSNISVDGTIKAIGMKKSFNRFVLISQNVIYFKKCKKLKINPFQDYDRYFLYRFCKSKGIFISHGKDYKQSVTHSLRYNRINNINQISDSIIETAKQIGHKSIVSTNHYINGYANKFKKS